MNRKPRTLRANRFGSIPPRCVSLHQTKSSIINRLIIFISAMILTWNVTTTSAGYRRICYHTNWAQYRQEVAKYTAHDIPGHLCSHLIYAFATLNGNRLKAFEWNDETQPGVPGMYAAFNSIKRRYPAVRTLLAVGGWNFGVKKMSDMLRSSRSRSEFARTSVEFIRNRTFDGLDLDFEYPADRGSPPEDKGRFTDLVVELRAVFEEEARRTGRERLILSAAVAAGKTKIDAGYDVKIISKHLDLINVMTYDFHGKWENKTGHNSPMHAHARETSEPASTLNLAYAANYWRRKGAPPSKINVGLPLYGRTFTLEQSEENGVGAPAKGGGQPGRYTREEGYMSFYEVCEFIQNGASVFWVNEQQVPYAVLGDQWLGFDDTNSLKLKVQWIMKGGFGGVMMWALDLDDFFGSCGGEPYPLLTAISQELGENITPNNDVIQPTVLNDVSRSRSRDGASSNGNVTNRATTGAASSNYGQQLVSPLLERVPYEQRITEQHRVNERRQEQEQERLRENEQERQKEQEQEERRRTVLTTRPPERPAPLPPSSSGKETDGRRNSRPSGEVLDKRKHVSQELTTRPTPQPSTSFCRSLPDGLYAHAQSCERYVECLSGVMRQLVCPRGTRFNSERSLCMLPRYVGGKRETSGSPDNMEDDRLVEDDCSIELAESIASFNNHRSRQ